MRFILLLDRTMIAEDAAGSNNTTVSSVWLNPDFYNKIRGPEPKSEKSRVNPRFRGHMRLNSSQLRPGNFIFNHWSLGHKILHRKSAECNVLISKIGDRRTKFIAFLSFRNCDILIIQIVTV